MKSHPETLVILTPAFPADETETHWVPTQQLFVKTLMEQFPRVKIMVLSFYYPSKNATYNWHGLQVTSFDGTQQRKMQRVFFWGRVWKELNRIRRENNIIGLFSFWCGECALIGSYFGRRHGIRHFCWLCGQDARKTNRMVKFIRPRPQELVAMSDFLVNEFYKNHGIRPGYMIPNAINPASFPRESSARRDIDILGAGSLSRLKRYDLFAEVVKSLHSLFPGFRAVLCGDGEDKQKIQAFIQHAALEAVLSLPGEMPHRETLELMQRAKIFLHTSEYEGFGVVCLEALYAGAHVISFSKPLNQEIPQWHVVQDMKEMIAKAVEILQDPATEYKRVSLYTMDATVKSVMALFEH